LDASSLPLQVEYLHEICPLESVAPDGRPPLMTDKTGLPIFTYVYKGVSERDGQTYCLRRVTRALPSINRQ